MKDSDSLMSYVLYSIMQKFISLNVTYEHAFVTIVTSRERLA